jgi:hypothetical protein
MNAEPSYDASTFEQVARLIAGDECDVSWLAVGLRQWVWPQERTPTRLRKGTELGFFASIAEGRWSRKRLLRVLEKTLPDTSKKVSELASDFAISSYLTDKQFGEGFDRVQIVHLCNLLFELRRRCEAVSLSPDLVSARGKAKAGRSKTLAPDQVDEKVACASAISVAWKFTRGEPPGAYLREAGQAAELLFAVGMAPPGRFDRVKPRRSWGNHPIHAWPRYFEKARKFSPILHKWKGMLEQELEFSRANYTASDEIPLG